MLTCDEAVSIERMVMCDLAPAGLCPPTSFCLVLYSLYPGHRPFCPSNDKPSYFSPQDLCTCCLLVWMLFLLPPGFLKDQLLLSLVSAEMSPLWLCPWCCSLPPFLGSHYWLLVCFLYSYGLSWLHIYFFLSVVFLTPDELHVARDMSYSILVYPTPQSVSLTIGFTEHFWNNVSPD